MNELKRVTSELNLKSNEIAIITPIQENFHPIAWLHSVGSFLDVSKELTPHLGNEALKSVQNAVN